MCTTNRARGAIEPGHEAVARRVDLDTAVDPELTSHHRVVRFEQVSPRTITKCRRVLGGCDDVGEEHGRKNAIGVGGSMCAGEEILDLVRDRHVIAKKGDVVIPRELNEFRARNALSDGASVGNVRDAVASAMEHKRRSLDVRQGLAHIDRSENFRSLAPRTRRVAKTFEARPPLLEPLVVARSLDIEVVSGSHLAGESLVEAPLLVLGPAEGPIRRPDGLCRGRIEDERADALRVRCCAPPKIAAVSEPAASMTARTSSICNSTTGGTGPRSESPIPRMSNRMSLENDASRLR